METTRQQKIAKQIQKDIADIFQKEGAHIVRGSLVTVTAVRVSPDFTYAKEEIERNTRLLRGELGRRIRNQIKSIPELQFFLDDSLEYIEHIDEALKR